MPSKGLSLSILALFLPVMALAMEKDSQFIKGQIKHLSGRLLLDAYVEATQPIQADKYLNFVAVSTPTATPSTGHAFLFANSAANQFMAKYSDGTTQVLGSAGGGGAGTITGVTAGTGLTGGGTTGTVTLNVNPSSVTMQANVFNGASQLVQLNSSSQLPAISGVNLTNLNASSLASGTVADGRLSTNVALLNTNQTFTGVNTFASSITVSNAFKAGLAGSAVTITSNTITPGATIYNDGAVVVGSLSASLPVQTDARSGLVSGAINLSGTQATGTLAAARMPALTGDVTTVAGAVATTAASSQANIKDFSSNITIRSTFTVTTASVSVNTVPYVFPGSQGSASTFLKNNGSGILTWTSASSVGSVLQIISTSTQVGKNTTSSTYQITDLSTTITPGATTNKILIFVTSTMGNTSLTGSIAQLTIFRDSTNLDTGTLGIVNLNGATAGDLDNIPATMIIADSPSSTSSIRYSVKLASQNNSSTVRFNNDGGAVMVLVEVGQ